MRDRSVFYLPFLLILTLPIFTSLARAQMIGAAPSLIDLGEVEVGRKYLIDIFLSQIGRETAHARLTFSPLTISSVPRRLAWMRATYSDQRAATMKFFEPVVEIPLTAKEYVYEGRAIRAHVRTSALLHIPATSEPGYHMAKISVTPVPPPGTFTQRRAVQIVTGAVLHLFYQVEGEAIRSGRIVGFYAQTLHDRVAIKVLFENNGTVTLRSELVSITLRRNNQTFQTEGLIGYVRPGTVGELVAYFPLTDITPGDYEVVAKVSWVTGSDEGEGRVRVVPPRPKMPTPAVVVRPTPLPLELVLIVALILLCLYYFRRLTKGKASRLGV
jgi:hypothetical protein